MTITTVTLLKRREGMSKEDFIAYYEEKHRRIGEQILAGFATRYVRRFLHPADGDDQPFDFDVMTEIDFPDQAAMDAFFASASEPATAAMIAEDEAQLFDRSRIRRFMLEESASEL